MYITYTAKSKKGELFLRRIESSTAQIEFTHSGRPHWPILEKENDENGPSLCGPEVSKHPWEIEDIFWNHLEKSQ